MGISVAIAATVVFALLSVAGFALGLVMIVGRRRFIERGPKDRRYPTTTKGMVALGIVTIVLSPIPIIVIWLARPFVSNSSTPGVAQSGAPVGVYLILFAPAAISLVALPFFVWVLIRRNRRNAAAGKPSSPWGTPGQRATYAGIATVVGMGMMVAAIGIAMALYPQQ